MSRVGRVTRVVTCFAYVAYLKQGRADCVVRLEKPRKKSRRRLRRKKIRRTAPSEVGRETLFVVEPTSIARLETSYVAHVRSTFLSAKPLYGTGRGLMSQISLAYWSMVRSELNLPEKAVEMMEDSVQPAWFLYASSTFAWHSM